ncbi:MAG: T9SS type A sorting domain-containing protein [Bacteroidia bacterium]|nr:T9SS type A sorting domain-containing protein [Bacteroidia bacterium]
MKKSLLLFIIIFCKLTVHAQSIPSYVPTNGLIGYWPFDGNGNDLGPGAHHGTVNGPSPTNDRFNNANKAYDFNGSNSDHILVPDHPSLSGFNDMTISFWVNFSNFNGIQNMVAKWYHVLNCGFDNDTYLIATSANGLYWNTSNHNVALQQNPPTFSNSDLNQWKHLVFTSSHINGEAIYINGVLADTYTASIGTICNSTNPLIFGAGNNTSNIHRFFTGKLDDMGIWARVLTNCEIQQLYNSALAANFTVSSTSNTLCAGQTATLTAGSAGTYTWNNVVAGNTFTINPTTTTAYTVIGTNTVTGCPASVSYVQQVRLCDGIESNDQALQIQFYPNPAEHLLHVNFMDGVHREYTISLTDITGKIILSQSVSEGQTILDVSELKVGYYFIRFSDDQDTLLRNGKLIIAR